MLPTPNDSSVSHRAPWRCQAKSGLTLRPMGRNRACYNYRATLISYRSCLKALDTFRYVWQGSQNHAYGKATFNLGTDHWFEDGSPTSRPARTLDRTGICRHVQWGDQRQHRLAAKAGRPVEATLEA